ncbi:hypothetical protein C8Q77DRAFT_1026903, partial [Trametes polyzona]
WLDSTQEAFTADLCRLFVACNISWTAVNHPYFRTFFARWVPHAILPSRKTLSGHILDQEALRVAEGMRWEVDGRFATGQCDGWKNITRDSLVASMLNVEYVPWLLNPFNVSAVAKTAQNLFEIVCAEIEYCMTYLSTVIVAYCTDAAGDTRAMRDLLRAKFPWIITLDCWAHQ